MKVDKMKTLVELVKATFNLADVDQDVAETKKTYELVKAGCENNPNFKRGVELYIMEYALKVRNGLSNEDNKSFEELMKELKGVI